MKPRNPPCTGLLFSVGGHTGAVDPKRGEPASVTPASRLFFPSKQTFVSAARPLCANARRGQGGRAGQISMQSSHRERRGKLKDS